MMRQCGLLRRAALAAGIAWLALGAGVTRADVTGEPVVSILSYNVHGLFRLAAKDSPRDRMPTIGWLANKYDVVLLQEDFEYADVIERQMTTATHHRGNGISGAPVLMLVRLVSLPVWLLVPRFSPPYGSGLSTYVPAGAEIPEATSRAPYDECAGWFESAFDCWARKGYLRVRMRDAYGSEVDIYNTHIEAGTSKRSIRSRQKNFAQLAKAVETLSAGRAVVVAGDFNVDYSRPYDREIITDFRQRLGLADAGAAPSLAVWRERDFILFRGGDTVRLGVVAAGEATEFVSGDRALSDHPALFVRLRVSRIRR